MTGDAGHSLGTAVSVLAAAACLALAIAARRRERQVRTRAAALLSLQRSRRRWRPEYGEWARRWAGPAGAMLVGFVLAGGVIGAVVGAAGAYGVWRRQRRRGQIQGAAAAGADEGTAVAVRVTDMDTGAGPTGSVRQLPLAADLLAACISAGAAPREAAEAVGESLGGPVGERLARVAAELRLGGEPAQAWGWFGRIPGAGPMAHCLERADSTGAPASEPVARLAERFRADRARTVAIRGRRAQVLITAPVGLCFLPAFLAIGVAPVVIALAGGLLHGN
ncbi:type II secretion system F family protein [Streptomyces sp. NPDC002889]|uniref:type II secretion system F family protein n=1 Tax=Streptomyces sp. NPDC002889 TaxID=3364669 RepID=UPI00367D5D5F